MRDVVLAVSSNLAVVAPLEVNRDYSLAGSLLQAGLVWGVLLVTVGARRARPADDLISTLVAAERSEPVMSDEGGRT